MLTSFATRYWIKKWLWDNTWNHPKASIYLSYWIQVNILLPDMKSMVGFNIIHMETNCWFTYYLSHRLYSKWELICLIDLVLVGRWINLYGIQGPSVWNLVPSFNHRNAHFSCLFVSLLVLLFLALLLHACFFIFYWVRWYDEHFFLFWKALWEVLCKLDDLQYGLFTCTYWQELIMRLQNMFLHVLHLW